MTWNAPEPEVQRISAPGWLRAVSRGAALGLITFGCLGLLLLLRAVERPVFGIRRPITPYITQFVCRSAFVILGIRYRQSGEAMRGQGAVVSNHASWLDIFSLNARKRICFVAKAEVARWPGIGWLARATGTVFIRRDSKEAGAQVKVFGERLAAGHKLLFFPEGTSTDGLRVLPFKSTLFAAFFTNDPGADMNVQPVTLVYRAPDGQPANFYGWWGDMDFVPHLLKTLAAPKQGSVELVCHAPVRVSDFADRKALALYCEKAVRSGLDPAFHRVTGDALSIP